MDNGEQQQIPNRPQGKRPTTGLPPNATIGNDGYIVYGPPAWQPQINPLAIQQRKKLQNLDKKALREAVKDAFEKERAKIADAGIKLTPENLVKEFQASNQVVLDAVKKVEEFVGKGVTSSQAGVTFDRTQQYKQDIYEAENELIYDKIKVMPTGANLRIFMTKHPELKPIQMKKLRELILLDDWTDIFTGMVPHLKRGAYNIIDWAHNKYVKPSLEEANADEEIEQLRRQADVEKKRAQLDAEKTRLQNELKQYKRQFQDDFADKDWGQVPKDQGMDPTTQMWKMARIPQQTFEQVPRSSLAYQTTQRLVDVAYIRACLCPEYYTAKAPFPGYTPCMTIQSSTNYTLSTTSTGSQVVLFNPGAAVASAAELNTALTWYCQNSTAFNTDTGAYTGLIQYTGALIPILSDISQYRLISASIAFVPTLSENNAQGSVSLCQYVNPSQQSITSSIPDSGSNTGYITNSAMSSNTTFVSGNIRSIYRQVTLPTSPMFTGQWISVPNNQFIPCNNIFALTIAGAPPSTVIGKVYVYYNYEVRYLPNATRFTQQQPSMYSSATLELLQHLAQHESLFMQNANDIRPPLEQTFSTDFVPTYDNVYNLLVTHAKSAKGRSVYQAPALSGLDAASNASFLIE